MNEGGGFGAETFRGRNEEASIITLEKFPFVCPGGALLFLRFESIESDGGGLDESCRFIYYVANLKLISVDFRDIGEICFKLFAFLLEMNCGKRTIEEFF